ncbi:MAG: anhydro-N-acetylmuramic acid kinase [Clostridia bacterium]
MKQWMECIQKDEKLAIGLMSGTSADGIDAALVSIRGAGLTTAVKQLAFCTLPFSEEARARILCLAGGEAGGSHELSLFSFWLGQCSADACLKVCEQAGVEPSAVDFVGSHGQTLYHIPEAESYLGMQLRATLQLGEPSLISEALGCPVVSDFRVRDMAAGGLGAPLVPYTEYLLYRSERETVALQNIGGIGNLTVLPKGGALSDTFAFDTGPGNMVMDALAEQITQGKQHYDAEGRLAQSGQISPALLDFLLDDPYLAQKPPKTTGRERYGKAYVERLLAQATKLQLAPEDALATATRFTAESIRLGVERAGMRPKRLIVGGGGSQNPVLMRHIADCLPDVRVMTNEAMGLDSNAKEAVAFAILANECLHGLCNNAPTATGARHAAVLGKISF